MALLNDLHHMTFLTADMDRLLGFYERIFDARVTFDRVEEDPPPRRRHAFIEIGPHTVLHPFEVEGVQPPEREPIFGRGRIDHFALSAASEEAFREIRRRLIAEGANATEGGLVTDMGSMWSFSFYDPDGGWHEVMWVKPGAAFSSGLARPAAWKMIDLDQQRHARRLATHPQLRKRADLQEKLHRACTSVTPTYLHGKKGVDGSSPAEGASCHAEGRGCESRRSRLSDAVSPIAE